MVASCVNTGNSSLTAQNMMPFAFKSLTALELHGDFLAQPKAYTHQCNSEHGVGLEGRVVPWDISPQY